MSVLLQQVRVAYQPKLPSIFAEKKGKIEGISEKLDSVAYRREMKAYFPHLYDHSSIIRFAPSQEKRDISPRKTGVIFSGGQAPGGHNVIAGLHDALTSFHSGNQLYGFFGGASGLLSDDKMELTKENIAPYRNTGGFDLIGSGRTKLTTTEQFSQVEKVCKSAGINGLVIIGGDDSNTNACILAEYFCASKSGIQVIGCPKTIDGDLKNQWIEISFGFDTACKVYSELIGNICRDAKSAGKYWHFIKLMGRSASHITLECALQTQPHFSIISEEVLKNNMTLEHIIEDICSAVIYRSRQGKNYGVVLIPEGLIEFIPEVKLLIANLNDILANTPDIQYRIAAATTVKHLMEYGLSRKSANAYLEFPTQIRAQLVMDRDPHGNVQVSKIETEKLLMMMVESRLQQLAREGDFQGAFSAQGHFFGYEGRAAFPSNFDANYTYSLGYTVAALLHADVTGYIAAIKNLTLPPAQWNPMGIPLMAMMNIERRHGKDRPVIEKSLTDIEGIPFQRFSANRRQYMQEDCHRFPGPTQFFGPSEICDLPPLTLSLEHQHQETAVC